MGVDFINRADRTFDKSCQKGFDNLLRVNLFDPSVELGERMFVVRFEESFEIPTGAELLLRPRGDDIGVYADERLVGVGEHPPRQLIEKLQFANQQLGIGKVEAVHKLSHTADVSVQ